MNLAEEAERYRSELQFFARNHDLPRHWFEGHDHLAVKAYNPDDYSRLIEEYLPKSEMVSETWLNGRRIAAARLLGKNAVDMMLSFNLAPGIVHWLEIIEARPEDQSDEPPRLDHEEIYFERGVIPIHTALQRKGLRPHNQKNRGHSWVSVIINQDKDELKFTDRRLADIIQEDIMAGRSKVYENL